MAAYASITFPVSKLALTGLLLMALGAGAQAREWIGTRADRSAQETIALAELPVQGQRTYGAILNGGPFRYEKDGSVFGNREACCRESAGAITESTRSKHPARVTVAHGASSAEASARHPRCAGTRQTTMHVSGVSSHER